MLSSGCVKLRYIDFYQKNVSNIKNPLSVTPPHNFIYSHTFCSFDVHDGSDANKSQGGAKARD